MASVNRPPGSRVRNTAKCTICGKTGRPLESSDYVCKTCKEAHEPDEPEEPEEDPAITRIRQQTEAVHNSTTTEKPPTVKQTRRSISLKGVTVKRVKDYAAARGRSSSSVVEELIENKLDEVGAPLPAGVKRPRRKPHKIRDFDLPLIL